MNVRYTIAACSYNMSKQIKTRTYIQIYGAAIHPIWTCYTRFASGATRQMQLDATNKFSPYPIHFESRIVICSYTSYIYLSEWSDINGRVGDNYRQTNDEFLFDLESSILIIITMTLLSNSVCKCLTVKRRT